MKISVHWVFIFLFIMFYITTLRTLSGYQNILNSFLLNQYECEITYKILNDTIYTKCKEYHFK